MTSPDSQPYRDVGLAEQRYLVPGELDYRLEVAKHIRAVAMHNYSDWALPGWEGILKRHRMLMRQADRLETCRTQYVKIGCSGCGKLFVGPRRCEVRICEHCAKKYAAKLRARQQNTAKKLAPSADGRRAMFVTVTLIRHRLYGPTDSDVRRIFRAFKKLMRAQWPTDKGCGALAVLEIGKNFNLHIHALVYGHYVNKFTLSALWHKLTGDSKIVRIKQVKNPEGCVGYLLKYITKPDQQRNPERAARWLSLLIGQRRVRTYGIFYGTVKLFVAAIGCPCPFCRGKLGLIGFDDGKNLPATAMFWDEAFAAAAPENN